MRYSAQQRHQPTGATKIALVLSVLLHLPLLFLFSALQPDDEVLNETNFDAQSAFSIDVVSEVEEDEKRPDPDQPEEKLQYVSLDAPEKEEKPDEARFADKYDSKVEEEIAKKAAPGSPQRAAPLPVPVERLAEADAEGDTESDSANEEAPPQELDEDGVSAREEATSPSPTLRPPSELFPSLDNAEAAEMLGDGGSIDYLRDVAEGDKTLLNRKRTRYWAFFDRVKRQVSKQWSPVSEHRKRDPYGNVYGVKDRYSTVDVTLNGDGTVRRLYLSRASGLDFFDDEAVRALKSAGPFHNPPEGLKDEDGLVHFTFGFYFEISSGSFRFMRINN